jgi:hypothetical protein
VVKEKVFGAIAKDAIDEPSEEEKATYRGFKVKNGGFVRGQGKAMRIIILEILMLWIKGG